MKIYDYDRRFSPYARYSSNCRLFSRKKLHRTKLIPNPDSYCFLLEQNTVYNRPFKVISYSLYSINMTVSIRQEIITNIRYRPERKEKIHFSVEYLIRDIAKNVNYCSKSDIQILYRVMNHFIHKNNKK